MAMVALSNVVNSQGILPLMIFHADRCWSLVAGRRLSSRVVVVHSHFMMCRVNEKKNADTSLPYWY
jgi:hypothetical protein